MAKRAEGGTPAPQKAPAQAAFLVGRGAGEAMRGGSSNAPRRDFPTCATRSAPVRHGERCGRDERSPRPWRPSSRPTHLAAVFALTLKAAAAAFNVHPCWLTLFANSSRLISVSRAFL